MEEIIDMEIKHWHHLNDEEENRLNRLLIGGYINNRQLIRYKDTKFAISENYLPMAERIRSFEVRNEDIWLMNFAKTGITWTSEIVWQIDRGIGADCDGKNIMQKCPFIESDMVNINLKGEIFSPFGKKGDYRRNEIFNRLDQMEERRIIKTHLPFCLLNPDLLDKTKVIYVARDPKDVCVSYFRFFDMMSHFLGKIQQGFDEYVECFKAGLGWCGDFWYHVHQAYEKRHHPNLLFIWYEDMKNDLQGSIAKIAHFMGKELDPNEILQLADMVTVENAKKNPLMNPIINGKAFIRAGRIGTWKPYFKSEKLSQDFDLWVKENLSKYGIDDEAFDRYI